MAVGHNDEIRRGRLRLEKGHRAGSRRLRTSLIHDHSGAVGSGSDQDAGKIPSESCTRAKRQGTEPCTRNPGRLALIPPGRGPRLHARRREHTTRRAQAAANSHGWGDGRSASPPQTGPQPPRAAMSTMCRTVSQATPPNLLPAPVSRIGRYVNQAGPYSSRPADSRLNVGLHDGLPSPTRSASVTNSDTGRKGPHPQIPIYLGKQ